MKSFLLIFFISVSSLIHAQSKKILIVSTNRDSVGANKSGTFLREIAYPFKYFTDNGFEVDVLTPKGGKASIYFMAKEDEEVTTVQNSEKFIDKTTKTLSPEQIVFKDYAAVFYPGGHGQYFDVVEDERIALITANIYQSGGIVGTAGHGVASLINVQLKNGKYLVEGKRITCFPTWAEKAFMKISNYGKLLAFDMQEVLKRRGAVLVVSTRETNSNRDLTNVVDSKNRIVTGAFASSAKWVAEEMVKLIPTRK